MFWCIMASLFGVSALVFLKKVFGDLEGENLFETLIVSIVIKGAVSIWYIILYAWGSEMFPSSIRGTAMGLSLVIGKMCGTLCQPLITFSENTLGVNAMVGCAITTIIPLPL